jgi:hypothetical protein
MDITADSIRRIGEADFLELGRVARSTWKNWVSAGVIEDAQDGLYDEAAVVELIIVAVLLSSLDTRQVKGAWRPSRLNIIQQAVALPLDGEPSLLAVVDLHTWKLHVARSGDELIASVRQPAPFPRGRVVFDLGASIIEGRRGYWARATPAADLLKDKRRKRRSAVATTRRQRGT